MPEKNIITKTNRPFSLLLLRVIAVTAGVTVLGSFLVVMPLWDWQPQTWQRFAMVWRERSLGVALPLLLVSAWQGRAFMSGLLPLGGVGSLRKIIMLCALAWRLSLVGLVSLIPALIVSIFSVTSVDTVESFPVFSLLASLVGIATAVPLGLTLGATVRRWAWPLSVSLIGMLIWYGPLLLNETLLLDMGLSSRSLSLSWGLNLPVPGTSDSVGISLLRIAYFLLLAMSGLLAYTPVGTPVKWIRKQAAILGSVATCIAVVIGVTIMSPRLPLVISNGERQQCLSLGNTSTTVCLFPSHESTRRTVTNIAVSLSQIVDTRMPRMIIEGTPTQSSVESVVLPVGLASTEEEYRFMVSSNITDTLVNYTACLKWDDDNDTLSPKYASYSNTVTAIQDRLILGSGVAPPSSGVTDDGKNTPIYSEEFAKLKQVSDTVFGRWYLDNYNQIMACDISSKDLP